MRKILSILLFTMVSLSLTNCRSTRIIGNNAKESEIGKLEINISTQEDVSRVLGSPTIKPEFTKGTWYYVYRVIQPSAILDPTVKEQRVVKISFNDKKLLSKVEILEDGQQEVLIDKDSTHVYGTESNSMQDFVKNFGRFNKISSKKKGKTRR